MVKASTPQCANKEILLDAYNKSFKEGKEFTDDISLLEMYHPEVKINLVEVNQENFKVTTEFDYLVAKALVENND